MPESDVPDKIKEGNFIQFYEYAGKHYKISPVQHFYELAEVDLSIADFTDLHYCLLSY